MVEFSRAEGSKSHRVSFLKTADNVISYIEQLKNDYIVRSDLLEVTRKERAAIIEDTIQFLKSKKVKLGKQLGRCNNSEINEELLYAINELVGEDRELIQINLVKINNRYEKIMAIGAELEDLAGVLSKFYVEEPDFEDEVVVDFSVQEENVKVNQDSDNDLEKVVDVHPASESLVSLYHDVYDSEQVEKDTLDNAYVVSNAIVNDELKNDELEEVSISDDIVTEEEIPGQEDTLEEIPLEETIPSDIEEIDMDLLTDDIEEVYIEEPEEVASEIEEEELVQDNIVPETVLYNTIELNSIQSEIDTIMKNEEAEEELQDDDSILFTITDKLNLKDIAKNVYGDESYWYPLYLYQSNKEKIDEKASAFGVSVEEVVSASGFITDVTLQFPTLLEKDEELENTEEHHFRRAA